MKPYTQLTESEKLALTNEEFSDAVKLEAISSGIRPPVTLSEAIKTSEWRGYSYPANGLRVWVLSCGSSYGAEIGYLTAEKARAALDGAVSISDVYHKGARFKGIKTEEEPRIIERVIPSPTDTCIKHQTQLVAFPESPDFDKFDALAKTCHEDWTTLLYNERTKQARKERWNEYLRLANNNLDIARAFWVRAGEGELPSDESVNS